MPQRTQKKSVRRIRPAPPRKVIGPPRRRGPLPGNRNRSVPWWAVALVAVVCGGILWLVLGQEDEGGSPQAAPSGPSAELATGAGEGGEVTTDVEPSAIVASRFPKPATGEGLELRVVSLGDDPNRCEAVSLQVGGEVRTAYHHGCAGRKADLAFFLVRLTGHAEDPVTVDLGGFELVTEGGGSLAPVELTDVPRSFPTQIALGSDVSRKGWVVFEARRLPLSLRYADDGQVLVVRFPGTWR